MIRLFFESTYAISANDRHKPIGLFRACPIGGLPPFSFQPLFKDLHGRPLIGFGKVVERQRRDNGHDVGVDALKGKYSTRLQCAHETRVGNRGGHTSVGEANRVGHIYRASFVDSQLNAWLQEKACWKENL